MKTAGLYKFGSIWQWCVLLAAVILPFFVIRFYPKFFHGSDVDDFYRWSQAWAAGWRGIYIACDRCNYPLLGTFFSGGIMSYIRIENFHHLVSRFRYYLAFVDAVNVMMAYFILNALQVKKAALWAGVIGLLPSSWLGASVWGQIDGIGQFLILSFFFLLISFNSKDRGGSQILVFCMGSGLLLASMLLTKQLIYFSLFPLGVIFLANMVVVAKKMKMFLFAFIVMYVSLVVPVLIADSALSLKEGYFSHLQYILVTGSQHGDTISYLGMNIWNYFTANPLNSSHDTLPLFSITPYYAGMALFFLIVLVMTFMYLKYVLRHNAQTASRFDSPVILLSLVYLALVNMAFNLTLTGVHERYLYHFYPYVIIGCLGWLEYSKYMNKNLLLFLCFGSLIYGLYLFGYLTLFIRPIEGLMFMRGMTTLNLFIFGCVVYSVWMEIKHQLQKQKRLDVSLS